MQNSIKMTDYCRIYLEFHLGKEFLLDLITSTNSDLFLGKNTSAKITFCDNYRSFNVINQKNFYIISIIQKTMTSLEVRNESIKIYIKHIFFFIMMSKNHDFYNSFTP